MSKKKEHLVSDVFTKRTEEEMEDLRRSNFLDAQRNPENMSYWFPEIESSTTKKKSILQLPKTHVVQIPYDWWNWLRSDKYTGEKIGEFNEYLWSQSKEFLDGVHEVVEGGLEKDKSPSLFMKTGVFSEKFYFLRTMIYEDTNIGENYLNMYYNSMIFGADNTAEMVLREFIPNKAGRPTIYSGMPLHTEYRVFYDFDKKEVVGISNYWHPDLMVGGLHDEQDELVYANWMDILVNEFDKYKQFVMDEVSDYLEGVEGLTGKWSVDVMKNDEEFWLIDMARMERSALIQQMEPLEES